MDIDAVKMEIDMLFARWGDRPTDDEELEISLREMLNRMRAFGQPLPEDLVALEAALDERLSARAAPGVAEDAT